MTVPGKAIAVAFLSLAYPFLSSYLVEQGYASLELLVFAGLTLWRATKARPLWLRLGGLLLSLLLVAAALFAQAYFVWLVPSLAYLGLTVLFGHTLWSPPSLCERLVRLMYPDFQPGVADYLREVTWVWTLFFAVNVPLCALLPLFAGQQIWAIYTGVLVYVLMTILAVAEWWYRHRRFPDMEIPPLLETVKYLAVHGHQAFRMDK